MGVSSFHVYGACCSRRKQGHKDSKYILFVPYIFKILFDPWKAGNATSEYLIFKYLGFKFSNSILSSEWCKFHKDHRLLKSGFYKQPSKSVKIYTNLCVDKFRPHWGSIHIRAVARSENLGGSCSTVVGIICPPGWDRVNCLANLKKPTSTGDVNVYTNDCWEH